MRARYKDDLVVVKGAREAGWLFGKPSLASANNGKARWIRGNTSPLDQKGATGWLAELYGGVQTGDDWARLNIPVNDLPLVQLDNMYWSWYQTATETMGLGCVIWIHDPDDFDKRAEVTQVGGASGLDKAIGWNSHEFDATVTQMFFYGENTTGTGLTAGTQYTWDEFQADVVFKNWTIYRITFDWGWEASGTFESVYVADVNIEEMYIPLKPDSISHKKTVLTTKTLIGGANAADDVVSEHGSSGTDWDFDFGGTGYITKAIITSATNAITPRAELQLYTTPPTCNLNDNGASTGPVAADVPFLVGTIDFPALHDSGTSHSFAVATPSTTGNLPLMFDAPVLYGVLVSKDAATWGNALVSILLSGDMED